MTFTLRSYQQEAVCNTIADLSNGLKKIGLILPTGCLAGNTLIKINRGKGCKEQTIKRLYNLFNGNPDKIKYMKGYDKSIPTYVRSYNGKDIRLHKISGVVYSGKKKVYKLSLENGKSIEATGCHKIMTNEGWIPIRRLEVGTHEVMCDEIICKGKKSKKPKIHDNMVCNLWNHPFAPTYSKVKGIEYVSEKDTYDIQCEDPYHNFVANDIIVHNSGKTEIFISIVSTFLDDPQNAGKSVLILSHLSILTDQTSERFKIRAPKIKTSIFQAAKKPNRDSRVVISTMQTSKSFDNTLQFKHASKYDVGLIIVDEAHYLSCDSYEMALDNYPGVPVIGCTATPFRSSELMTNYFDKISYSISLQELISAGHLVPPTLKQIVKQSNELQDVVASVIQIYKAEQMGKKAIVFMKTIEDAKLLRNVFEDMGIRSRAVTSGLKGADRNAVLNEFNHGDIDILTTVNVLSAGFDAPKVQSIFMPYATKSPTLYLQRVGRGLRKCPELNKQHCDIYVFGSAPSISKKLYVKLNNMVLNKNGKVKEYPTMTEELDYNDWDTSSETYLWTRTVVDTINHMRSINMDSLASLLEHKKFPKRFLKNISQLLAALPNKKCQLHNPKGPITIKQMDMLSRHGFTERQLKAVTKGEASSMIAAVMNPHRASNPFTVLEGKYKGSHISELPHAYRSNVKKKFPDSPVSQLIHKWETHSK